MQKTREEDCARSNSMPDPALRTISITLMKPPGAITNLYARLLFSLVRPVFQIPRYPDHPDLNVAALLYSDGGWPEES